MVTRLADNAEARQKARQAARVLSTLRTDQTGRSPWAGYTPDIDPNLTDFKFARRMEGLVARPDPNRLGELLFPDDGFGQLDAARLPLATPQVASSTTVIVRLDQAARTTNVGARSGSNDITPLAITAGDNATAGSSRLWRIDPNIDQWSEITHLANAGPPIAVAPQAGREFMPDSCMFPAGAPGRTSYAGPIVEPTWIWTNDVDPVYVFPAGTGLQTFQDLNENPAALSPFIARSCETFNGRIYFLNTSESGTRRRQRLRRTAIFQADPDTTLAGSGSHDLQQFSGDGLRAETLGDVLALYFEDGVAFLRPTGVATAPDEIQVLTTRRGLLGTHAVTDIGSNTHFGIFTDGWWLLDSSGRWREAGVGQVNKVAVEKWKKTFYTGLDVNRRHRLQVEYRQETRQVYIANPRLDTPSDDVEDVWIYDIDTDRVFIEKYPVTCWGAYTSQITSPLLWSGAAAIFWNTIIGSWASQGATFGTRSLVHGTLEGFVELHDPNLLTRDQRSPDDPDPPGIVVTSPSYLYETHCRSFDKGARNLYTAERLLMEYINASGPNATFRVFAQGMDAQEGTVDITRGVAGDVETAERFFRLSGQHLGFQVRGTAPVLIRSFDFDYFTDDVEPRFG